VARAEIIGLTMIEREALSDWLASRPFEVPEFVLKAATIVEPLLKAIAEGPRRQKYVLEELRRAMGILPKSERRSNGSEGIKPPADERIRPKDPKERLLKRLEMFQKRMAWHTLQRSKRRKEMNKILKRLGKVKEREPSSESATPDAQDLDPDSGIVAPELMQALLAGKGVASELAPARQDLTKGSGVVVAHETRKLFVAPDRYEGMDVIDTLTEERTRYDFSLNLTQLTLEVERKTVIDGDGLQRILTAPTASIGPPHFPVTWEFMANIVLLIAQRAIPMNRLGGMLSSEGKTFSVGAIANMLHFVAWHFLPLYLYKFNQLANAAILVGDDTSARVLEAKAYFADKDPKAIAPWEKWPTRDSDAQDSDSNATIEKVGDTKKDSETPDAPKKEPNHAIAKKLASELGFCFPLRNGDGYKKALNTTVISGRSEPDDPRSTIVFYRTHLGGLGNLLEVLLERRDPTLKHLTIQSDLSPVNFVRKAELLSIFRIKVAGCSSHARRPFARYYEDDPETCELFLGHFSYLAGLESGLNEIGRNHANVKAVRDIHAREVWSDIFECAEMAKTMHSKSTKIGDAACYLLDHRVELTAYLDDARLCENNNFSERMIRMEKMIEKCSHFRATLEGRFVLDILRTEIQTAIAANARIHDYLVAMLKTPREVLELNPKNFTSYAWAAAVTNRCAALGSEDRDPPLRTFFEA
jgi:hypothetical protein